MEFRTVESWDEDFWGKWREIYYEAFGKTNAKPEKVIRNMFQKQMCFFHIAQNKSEVQAIALSGKLQGTRIASYRLSRSTRKRSKPEVSVG